MRFVITPTSIKVYYRRASIFITLKSFKIRLLKKFLISNFRCVLNAVCFLLGNSAASEFYMPTFRNSLFQLHRRVGMKHDYVWGYWRKYSNILKPRYYSNLSAYEDGTECSETSVGWVWRMTKFQNVLNTPTFSNLVIIYTYPPMKMEQTECSETSVG